ncbi:MAG: hypothetical protein NC095_10450 [Muribaculum sp.]|nr:hypothetical protein [Muribaculum sp.]
MKIKIYHILAASLMISFAGCSDSDEWTPGPSDEAAGTRAYFISPTKTSYIFDSESDESEQIIDVTVARLDTENATSVPLALTSETEGFSLLGNAEFEAGQAKTTVSVSCSGLPMGQRASFTLAVPEDQFYTYGEGLPSVSFSAIKASWVECADNVTYMYQYDAGGNMYPNTHGQMFRLEGTNQYKLTDFFGSGLEMQFICNTGKSTQFIPLINCDFNSAGSDYDGLDYWYLYDDENQTWPEWTPGDVEGYPAVQYVGIYGSTGYSSMNMVYNESTLYGYLTLATDVTFDNGDFSWGTWYVTFNMKYNPFK